MTPNEIAWLAGLLEGEGYFRATNASRGNPEPVVQLSMTDRDIVERARAIIGVKTKIRIYDRKGQANYKEYHKPLHVLWIRGYAAIRVMEAILPYMGERRTTKIKEAISIWNNRTARTRERGLPPDCHPERKHYCRGFCRPCYSQHRAALIASMALIDHSVKFTG